MSLTWLTGTMLVVLCWGAGTSLSVVGRRRAALVFAGSSPGFTTTMAAQLRGTCLNRVLPANGGLITSHARLLQGHGARAPELTAALLVYGTSHVLAHLVAGAVVAALVLAHAVPLEEQLALPSTGVPPGLVTAAVVVLGCVLSAAPRPRRALVAGVRHLVEAMRLAGSSAGAVLTLALLEVGTLLLLGVGLFVALHASGASLSLPVAVCVLVACNLLAGAVPAPGGAGPVDLALVGALTSVGVAASPALTAVGMFRLVTHWMPVPLGLLALAAQRRGLDKGSTRPGSSGQALLPG